MADDHDTRLIDLVRGERWLVGAMFFGTLGILTYVLYLLTRRRNPGWTQVATQAAPALQGWSGLAGASGSSSRALPGPALNVAQAEASPQTMMRTINLPGTRAAWLFTATGDAPWRVEARHIGAAGTFAVLSTDMSAAAASSNGNTLTIPTGGFNQIRLLPGQSLYGRGGTVMAGGVANGVILSLTASTERRG